MAGAPESSSASARTCLDCDLAVVGRSLRCDGCKVLVNRARAAKWNQDNREQYNARERERYATDPEKRQRHAAKVKAWREANPDAVVQQKKRQTPEQRRNWTLRSRYGITLDEQQEMWARQGASCLICMTSLTKDNLAVDHDHETGEVRGLLCRICNSALGAFEADPMRLLAAFSYLTTTARPWLAQPRKETA